MTKLEPRKATLNLEPLSAALNAPKAPRTPLRGLERAEGALNAAKRP
jgi:hypothetical protein